MGSNRKGMGKRQKGKARVRTSMPKVGPDDVAREASANPPKTIAEISSLVDLLISSASHRNSEDTESNSICGVDDCPLCDFISRRKSDQV